MKKIIILWLIAGSLASCKTIGGLQYNGQLLGRTHPLKSVPVKIVKP
jgi:hypothetical protein